MGRETVLAPAVWEEGMLYCLLRMFCRRLRFNQENSR